MDFVELAFYYFWMCVLCTEQKLGHSLLFHWLYVISINFHGLSVLDLILSIFIIS
jgi:hypothetical protein